MVHHNRLAGVAARIKALRSGSMHFKKRWYLHLVKFCPLEAAFTLPISCARHISIETQRNNLYFRSSWHPFQMDLEEVAVEAMGSRRSVRRNEPWTSKEADARATSLSGSQPPRDGLANHVSGLDEHDGPSTYRWVVEQQTDTLPLGLYTLGENIDTTLGSQGFDTERQSGPMQDTENLQAPSPAQNATTNTSATISTNSKDLFVPRDLEMLYEHYLKCVLGPNNMGRSGEEALSQGTAMQTCFITPSHHFYRALSFYHSLKPDAKLRTSKESRQQRQRGVPTLSIPKFQSLGAFSDWYTETERTGEERRVKISRMHNIATWMQEDCRVGSMARDTKCLQTTDELKQDLDKLRRKAQKWDMQLAAFSYCHHVCGILVTFIDHMKSEMKARQRRSELVENGSHVEVRQGPEDERLWLPSEATMQGDFVGKFMMESDIHRCFGSCESACSQGPEPWADRHRQRVLNCINKHAETVRGKVRGHEARLGYIANCTQSAAG
jgi:hypothetical protein